MASECPINIECKVFKTIDCGSHVLCIGEVTEVYASKEVTVEGTPDILKIDPIVYSAGSYWKIGKQIGKGFSAGKAYKKK
jgi:flavin reductase (DIM6/NTAB) family NADH-FMN oxidoreductase RutF